MSKEAMLDFMTRDATKSMEGASYVIGLIANDLRREASAEEHDLKAILNAASVLEQVETDLYRQAANTRRFYGEAMAAQEEAASTGETGDR